MKKTLFFFIAALLISLTANTQTITVTSPNGGESWPGCTQKTITWTASGTSNYYSIDYSTTGGSSWTSIASFYNTSSGSYSWTVPNVSSSNCIVRVYDANNPTVTDVSNAVFTVIGPLILTSPNGGENWQGLTSKNITWTATGTSNNYNLEYSINAGSTWNTIATGYSTTSGSYAWTVPNTPSASSLVRIRDYSNACMTIKSNNLFTISPAQPTVTSPNGGESWIAGTSKTITWNSATYTTANVVIDYSIDSGANWISVLTSTPNDGSQAWVVPNTPSVKALIRISEYGNLSANDKSDAVFTIAPYITLTSPNGGENYLGCEVKTISWTAGNTSGQYTIQYSTDNGSSWTTIIQNYATSATNCTYSWTVNNLTSANCMIKVLDLFDSSKSDRSDGSFTITGTSNVVLNSPNGGEQLKVGYTNPIQYVMSGPTTSVKILYSTDNGVNWTQITSNTSGGSYNWSVPNTPSPTSLIRVEDRLNSCNYDQSDTMFTIVPHITITSPNGGEYLYGCNSSTISWIAGGTSGVYKIEYSSNNGTTWNSIINSYSTSSISCSYTWSVLPNVSSNNCLIRVSDASNLLKTDVSDANFTLAASSSIVVLSPNGGENWKAITSSTGSSGSYNMSNTSVTTSSGYFYDSGGSSGNYSSYESYTKTFTPAIPGSMLKFEFTTFSTYTSSDRLYIYNGPTTSSPLIGSYYSSYSPGTITASNPTGQLTFVWTSSSYSYTGWAATISVINPNPTNITWASNNVSNYYDIYYSTNSGTTWNPISYSYYTTGNSYNWTIPNTPSTSCLVRIDDANNNCKTDQSNGNFTIVAATPYLLTPNGGEGWFAGTSKTITWANASYLSTYVSIDYSLNNGQSWINISPSVPNNGTYSWTVPNTPSVSCLVKVSEVGNPLQKDTSDAVFSILPYITVTAPNGGNILEGCNNYTIRWTTGGTSGSFNIDYTSDNGVSWNNIVTGYTTSSTNATYTWATMPNISLPNCRIRVRDAADATKNDQSDSSFSLTQTSNVIVVSPNGGEILQGWGSYNVQYSTSGSTSYVNLSYSLNNGTTWNSIVSSTSGGSYSWTLPNSPSSNCLIKAEDYSNSCKTDQSNAAFTIIPAARQLTAPNGGEVWLAGKTQSITWTSGSFLSTYVKIDYSIDSGVNWLPIVASVTNNGSYSWIIPNNPSERSLIRVSEVGNPSAFDISDAKFTIAPYITLTSPNGGENYLGCEVKTISWTAGNTSGQYTIQYSTNNGSSWTTIIQNYATSATNCTYSWTVNNLTSANCMIKVLDLFDSSKSDRSDGSFTITGTSNVVLNSPNGGEQLKVGYTNPIQYVMSGPTTSVKILYSTDNGVNWTQITSNTSGGSYNWSVPNTPSPTSLIRVEDRLNSCNYDQSDTMFTIVPHITITSPNGGEYLYGCNSSTISWIAGGTSGVYKIEYSSNNGTTWNSIINSYSTSSISCSYIWSVLPNVSSNNCLIRVSDASNLLKTDVSDANFTLAASSSIVVLSPNGGENWKAITSSTGSSGSYNMSNSSVITSAGYFYDSGGSSGNYGNSESYTKTFTPSIPGSMLKFEFTSFSTYNSSDRLYIYNGPSTSSPLIGSYYYSSYGPGTVTASNPTGELTFYWTSDASSVSTGWAATISIVNPYPTNITWASNNVSNYYDIYYSTNSGTTWNPIVYNYYTTGSTYNWTIPNIPSTSCLVRIDDANNTCKTDQSNGNFTIVAATPYLLTPNGGEGWFAGTSKTITWANASYLSTYVSIDYSLNNGQSWINISPSVPNNGTYSWTVPNTPSVSCLVKVSEVGNPLQKDTSDAVFSILPYITVTAPNGGNILEGCNNYTIRWTTGGTSGSFNIDYTSDNGVSWNNIVTGYTTSSTNATYTWATMPNISLPNCRIRVRDAADATKNDQSDSSFSLTQTSNVIVVSPNGGEILQGWGSYNIQYSTSGSTSYVNLSYSLNNGTTWNSIVSSTSGGSYSWTLPNSPSANCLIKAEDYSNSCKTDQSNAAFTIIPAARQLTAPNGGESWIAGTSRSITWTSGSFLSTYVKIEYSTDSGANWITVVASVTNNGSYSWTTPNTPSSKCLVKVSEVNNPTAYDISDNTFTIAPFITITYPNGGENLMGCEIKNITWTAGATSQHYLIEYSTDNGSSWATIISDYYTTATNCTYSWTVNNAVSSLNCKIRITDLFTPMKTDISDNSFSITQVTNALLLSPNGNESWKVGTTQQIKYSTSGPTTLVKLYYSIDNGSNWTTITSSTSGGTYNWSVPNIPSAAALIKVEDKTISCNADQSDAVFTIEPHITLTSPNGGEVLYGCGSNTISWFAGGTSNYYKIEYSTNGGTTWNTIVSSYYSTSITNTYSWAVIPNLNSSTCLIKVSDATNASKSDVSDAYFSITNTTDLILFTPNGGEQWQSTVGASSSSGTYLMNSNTAVTTSAGYFYDAGGSSGNYGYNENYTKTFTPEIPGNMLRFTFSSFSTYNSNDMLYIYNGPSTSSPLIGSYYSSYSPGTVTASNPTGQLTFRWTSDGSSVSSGWAATISSVSITPNLITWAASNTSQYYNLYYSTNSGSTWNTIVNSYYTTGSSYQWNIPNTPSSNCLLKIEDVNNTCKFDISNNVFKIIAAKPAVITPNGDETWYSFENREVTWANATFLSANVVIEYSLDSGYSWNTIAAITPNDGTHTWTIPAFNKQYNNCLVRVSEYGNTSVNDISNAVFKLTPPILITSPNGDNGVSSWRGCTQSTITWKAGTSSYYNIDYSINNGSTWTSVVSNYYNASANVTYSWSVPNTPSNQCLVKVTDYNSSIKTDVSDSTFTISPTITLLQPTYGGVLQAGSIYNIKWTADGTSNFYDIEYSTNGGNTWNSIAYNYQSTTGIYAWTIPNTLSSNCMVRVTDNVSSCKTDKSKNVFTISSAPSAILLTSPNGGESINSCTPFNISWTATGTSNVYTIEYSTNGGNSWNSIVSNLNTSSGTYSWNVPNINATTCLIKVKDANNTAIYDASDAAFSIIQTVTAVITANGSTTFCSGDNVILTSNSSSGNLWSPGGQTTQSITVTNSATYTLTVNNGSGCSAISIPKTVTVNPLPTLPVITANGSTNICAGNSVILSSAYNSGNTWFPTNETTKDINVSSSGTFTVKYTDANGCSSVSAPISVTVNQLSNPPVITAAGSLTFCAGDSVVLTSSAITGNIWSPGNQTSKSITVYNSGSYSVSVGNGCSAPSAAVNVTVNPSPGNPVITPSGPTTFCEGGNVILTSSYTSGNQWSPGNQASQSINITSSGFYSVKVIGGNGCPAFSVPIQVNVNTIPLAPVAYSNSPVPLNGTLILSADSVAGTSYAWTGPNNFTSSGRIISIPNASSLLNGNYYVKASKSGCEGPSSLVNVSVASSTSQVNISGIVKSENNAAVKAVTMNLTGVEGNQSFITGANGSYNFNVTASNSYTLTPFKNNDSVADNGISTLDIILMQRHILNIDTLNSPYKIIAADVNGSGNITTMDIILTRRMILHTSNFFPGNKLWSFVSSDYIFSNPKNPFPYSESKLITNASQLNNLDFIAIKLGDVNNSWNNTVSKSSVGEISFFTEGQNVSAGSTITVPVKVKDFNNVSGYQFTLNWNANAFELLSVNNIALENFYGNQQISNGKLAVLWSTEIQNGITLNDGTVVFELTFKVVGNTSSVQELVFNSSLTKAEAFNNLLEPLLINAYMSAPFVISNEVGIIENQQSDYYLYQNNPNPFSEQTEIVFELPDNERVEFIIYNTFGEIVNTFSGNFSKGINRKLWKVENIENGLKNGTYYLQMRAGKFIGYRKIVVLR